MSKEVNPVFIIAEAGVNHNGELSLAIRLCDEAFKAGVDAIKFQTWKTEKVITRNVAMAEYQKQNTNLDASQFDMIKKLELSYADFIQIQQHCDAIGIKFLSTPDEEESLDFLLQLGMDVIKIGSGDINNIPYLRKIGKTRLPVILSTGMSSLANVERALDTLTGSGTPKVTLLHCTTNYPCPMDEVNLRAIQTLASAFGTEVGYSDHTMGIEVSIAAVALGARIIEKHVTLDRNMNGPDHSASLEPGELREMVLTIRNIERALGNGIKKPNVSEQKIEAVVKKKIVAAKPICEGEIFNEKNLTVKRSANGVSAEFWDWIYGRKANRNYAEDEPINF
jgi:N-acetylneuraminate synthase/N,N'-diacetyllegionaminate synthase